MLVHSELSLEGVEDGLDPLPDASEAAEPRSFIPAFRAEQAGRTGEAGAAVIPNITQGDRMAGLWVYLAGPGRANEHEDPHLVAGDPAVVAWHDDDELERDAALAVAAHLDRPRKFHGTAAAGGHVFYGSLSLPADDGQLTDQQWAEIAEEFVPAMGFTGDHGNAPCRWAAVRHGRSRNGNDHIHLVASMSARTAPSGTRGCPSIAPNKFAGPSSRRTG